MRAAYLLLGLALLRDSAASIFRHQARPHPAGLVVHPLDYVDRYQQDVKETKRRLRKPAASSEETKERFDYDDLSDYVSPLRPIGDDWNSPPVSITAKGGEAPYGDAISWRGVDIAAGQNAALVDEKDIARIFDDASKTMQHLSEEDKKKIHEAFEANALADNENAHSNATQLLTKRGYGVEEHVVKTEDGYYLTLFRIRSKSESQGERKRPVVLLVHGLLGSADDWLLMSSEKSLAYLLSDAGYDVWLGNVRGSKHSRRHASKHPSHPDFWHFSIDEIARHDVPAMIDHALETAAQKKLHYVGHSQGATVFFAWASTHPDSEHKIETMHALSPMVYMTNARSPLLRMIAPSSPFFEALRDRVGRGEFEPSAELIHTVGGNICRKEIGCEHVCSDMKFVVAGADTAGMAAELVPAVVAHSAGGASARLIRQLGQAVSSHEFRKYDYGAEINDEIYGGHQPPKYNMTEVRVPVTLYSSEEDWLAHPKDVDRLAKELPELTESHRVGEKHFGNMDFLFSERAPAEVYERLIRSIEKRSGAE